MGLLPTMPMIPEAELKRGWTPYMGEIERGMIFAWEPDEPKARELIIVIRVDRGDETYVWSRPLSDKHARATWASEGRFREAVVETLYKPQNP